MGVIKKRGITYAGGGGEELPDYSTTEHKTGRKWIDGKDIWECTSPNHGVNLPYSSAWISTGIRISGDVVDVRGSILRDGEPIALGYFNANVGSRWILRNYELLVSVSGDSAETYTLNYVTAEYTKSS